MWNSFLHDFPIIMARTMIHAPIQRRFKSIYFHHKIKIADDRFLIFRHAFLGWSVFSHITSQGHSTVSVPKRCEGFVAIWSRAREEFADNHFQLLFIYIDNMPQMSWLILTNVLMYSWVHNNYGQGHDSCRLHQLIVNFGWVWDQFNVDWGLGGPPKLCTCKVYGTNKIKLRPLTWKNYNDWNSEHACHCICDYW